MGSHPDWVNEGNDVSEHRLRTFHHHYRADTDCPCRRPGDPFSAGASRDAGINFFNHADVYVSGELFAEERPGVAIQSKVGIRSRFRAPEHILRSVDESFKALTT